MLTQWDTFQDDQLILPRRPAPQPPPPLHAPGALQVTVSTIQGLFACLFSKSGPSIPQVLPAPSPMTFKTPGFKPH